jgi:hypothetical protein
MQTVGAPFSCIALFLQELCDHIIIRISIVAASRAAASPLMLSHSSHYRHKTGISAAEAQTLHRVFNEYDLNKDDKVSFGELQNKFVAVEKGNM